MLTKRIISGVALAASTIVLSLTAHAADLTGAGATFPYPIYSKWAEAYNAATGIGLNYQSIGSGGGIRQIKAKTVDFGASDMPLKLEELEKEGLMQFPAIIGGVVPVMNLDGIAPGQLKLTADVISAIHLGKITKWNAPEITALNPNANLPALAITVVHRADGSGTTFLWTDYLSKANADFKATVGSGTAVKWPTGVGGKGNEGVAANVQRIKGAFGYVEYAYAKKNKIVYAQLKNMDGQFVLPDDESFKAAAANGDWSSAPGMYLVLTNQPGKASWPATGASFIIMHKSQADGLTGRAVLKFFDWSFKNGSGMASELDYVPMPPAVVKLIQDNWKSQLKDPSGKAIW
ncbi:MAG: phosphate transporter substrate-binding protein PstS [Pseudomonadota bacterium]|jgi:phosphate transport system substrate-binding protein